MKTILVTGSTDGVGRATAQALLDEGHRVVVHARNQSRLDAVADLLDRGATPVVGELSDLDEVRGLAEAASALGRFDAVIHNAGTMDGAAVLPVNAVAPYVLTAAMTRPDRLIYVSSSMHRGGTADLSGIDWTGARQNRSYSDSKLYVTTLMAAVDRLWPDVTAHAVDPGWVPTKMGGPGAGDDLDLAHVTQVWLATSDAADVLDGGRYWHHEREQQPHPAVHDEAFQDELVSALGEATGVAFPRA